jgi:hypothetical protein
VTINYIINGTAAPPTSSASDGGILGVPLLFALMLVLFIGQLYQPKYARSSRRQAARPAVQRERYPTFMGTTLTVIALIVPVLTGCVTREPLTPGQLFSGRLLDIRAPASAGWELLESGTEVVAFGRYGASPEHTYVANVFAFPLPTFSTPDDLLAFVKAGVEKDAPPDRFKVFVSIFEFTSKRPYPCVRYRSSSQDMKARTRRGIDTQLLHIHSLYCQHPAERNLGMMISYSQRGGPPDPDLDSQAQSFIDGVQVPMER